MWHSRSLLASLVTFLALSGFACAPAGTAMRTPDMPVPTTVDMPSGSYSVGIRNSPDALTADITSPLQQAWAALPGVYDQIGLTRGGRLDEGGYTYGVRDMRIARIAGKHLDEYLDCGDAMGGPREHLRRAHHVRHAPYRERRRHARRNRRAGHCETPRRFRVSGQLHESGHPGAPHRRTPRRARRLTPVPAPGSRPQPATNILTRVGNFISVVPASMPRPRLCRGGTSDERTWAPTPGFFCIRARHAWCGGGTTCT